MSEITQIRVVAVEGNGRVTSKAYNEDSGLRSG